MTNLPDDVTPAMLDGGALCVECQGPTVNWCENCDGALCDTQACEAAHFDRVGHGPMPNLEPDA